MNPTKGQVVRYHFGRSDNQAEHYGKQDYEASGTAGRSCPICGAGVRGRQQYCGSRCRQAAYRARLSRCDDPN